MLAGSRYKVTKWTIICPGLSEKSKSKKSDRAVTHNLVFVKTAQSVFSKNHDELITPTVRVSISGVCSGLLKGTESLSSLNE